MKHILFDTDGVIVDSTMWSHEYSQKSWISTDVMIPFFRWVFQDCLIGKADLKESIAPYLREWWWKEDPQKYLDSCFAYENHVNKAVIEKVRVYRASWIQCHVATNQEKYRLAYLCKEMWFLKEFDSVFCSSEIWYKKPATEFYTYILDTLQIQDPSQILYYDDASENIQSAKQLWINAILYKTIADLEITPNSYSPSPR